MGAFIWSFSCDAQLGRDPMTEIAGGIIVYVPSVLETHCYPTGTEIIWGRGLAGMFSLTCFHHVGITEKWRQMKG